MQCKCQELFPIAEWWEAGIRSFTELTNTRNEDDSVKPAQHTAAVLKTLSAFTCTFFLPVYA